MQLRLELEEEKMAEEEYEEMLRREAEQLTVRDFQPKVTLLAGYQNMYSILKIS
jgi:hypothetical protein